MVKLLFRWLCLLRMLRHPNVELVYTVVLLGPLKSGNVMNLWMTLFARTVKGREGDGNKKQLVINEH